MKLARGEYTTILAHKFMSYKGYLKVTNSVKVKQKYIDEGKINTQKLKELIRNESRNFNSRNAQAVAA